MALGAGTEVACAWQVGEQEVHVVSKQQLLGCLDGEHTCHSVACIQACTLSPSLCMQDNISPSNRSQTG